MRAKTGWDEKILHAPSEVGMFVAALMTVAPLGVLAVVGLVAVIILAAVVFT